MSHIEKDVEIIRQHQWDVKRHGIANSLVKHFENAFKRSLSVQAQKDTKGDDKIIITLKASTELPNEADQAKLQTRLAEYIKGYGNKTTVKKRAKK